MKKKIFDFILNILIFWVVLDLIPGLKTPYGGISKFYGGIVFAIALELADTLRSVFGLPKLITVRVILGTILTFGVLWVINSFAANVFSFGPSFVGGANMIFFNIPKLFVVQDINMVLLLTALIGNFCSIIIFKIKH